MPWGRAPAFDPVCSVRCTHCCVNICLGCERQGLGVVSWGVGQQVVSTMGCSESRMFTDNIVAHPTQHGTKSMDAQARDVSTPCLQSSARCAVFLLLFFLLCFLLSSSPLSSELHPCYSAAVGSPLCSWLDRTSDTEAGQPRLFRFSALMLTCCACTRAAYQHPFGRACVYSLPNPNRSISWRYTLGTCSHGRILCGHCQ